ncbi:MAG: hypothetical protein ACFFCF_03255 [Promethearchaeota archaeon]
MLSFNISDCPEPRQGKSAPIQKGLIPTLQDGGLDLCGEGLGFGAPILQYRRDFYFPGTSTVSHGEETKKNYWIKKFSFNLIERKQPTSSNSVKAFSWILPRAHNQIYKMKTGRQFLKFITWFSRWDFPRRGTQFAPQFFIPVKSRGESQSQYFITKEDQKLVIKLSFDTIVRNTLQSIYIANELGGHHFTQYYDASGTYLDQKQIEPWAKIKGSWAAFYAPRLNFGFRVEIPAEGRAYRGREVLEEPEIFWSGIILQLPKSTRICKYEVQFGTLQRIMEGQ